MPAWQQSNTTGSRTPAYAPADGSRTVNPYSDGSRTAYGGGGAARTPAWNPTATSSSFTHDPFGGSRTPAYEPSYSANSGAGAGGKVGRAYDAPTPGKEFAGSAPTPGASNGYVGQTPAATGAAAVGQTPKFSGDAPTPFGGLPETPGWSGEDGGPRYEEGTPSP